MRLKWIIALWAVILVLTLEAVPWPSPAQLDLGRRENTTIRRRFVVTLTPATSPLLQTPVPPPATPSPSGVLLADGRPEYQGIGSKHTILAQGAPGEKPAPPDGRRAGVTPVESKPGNRPDRIVGFYVGPSASETRSSVGTPAPTDSLATTSAPPTSIPSPTPTGTPEPSPSPTSPPTGWQAAYFAGPTLAGPPTLIRVDSHLDFDWGESSPAPDIPADNFAVRWVRTLDLIAGTYRFELDVDDGVRLWLDDRLLVDEWHDASAGHYEVLVPAVTAGQHTLRLEYYEHGGVAQLHLKRRLVALYPDWQGRYFANWLPHGLPVLVRNDPAIDFDWGQAAPHAVLPADAFSVRWTRWVDLEAGTYRFRAQSDDGVRLWVDDELLIDAWRVQSRSTYHAIRSLGAGAHSLRVEYYEHDGEAAIRVGWERVSDTPPSTLTPAATPTLSPSPTVVLPSLTPTLTASITPSQVPPTSTPSPVPTETSTQPSSPTLILTPTPSLTPTALTTATVTPATPAGSDNLTAQAFIDHRCDGFFQSGIDIPLKDARVTLSLPDGTTETHATTPSGMASFATLDASSGVDVSIEWPEFYRSYTLQSCLNSPANVELQFDDFQFGFKMVQFRAQIREDSP